MKKHNKPVAAADKAEVKASKRAEKSRRRDELVKERERLKAEDARQKAERKRKQLELAATRQKAKSDLAREKARVAELRRAERRKLYAKIRKKLNNLPSGFNYRNHGILPRVELIVSGDSTSIVSRLAAAGVSASDIARKDGKATFKIRKKDLHKAVAILNEMCYNYQIGENFGVGKTLAFCASRAGLFAGAALAVCLMNFAYGYIWRVDISGNDKLSAAAIENVLKSSGVAIGKRKSRLDTDAVSAAINMMDGVADAAAEVVGTTLCVYVLEAEDYEVHGKYGAYKSDYDATITRIVLRNGTAAVARGDVVKRGDTLVSGEVYSTAGELLFVEECDAEIYGNVSLAFSADVGTTTVEYRRTGNSKTRTVFELFGCRLGKNTSPYAQYDCTSTTSAYDAFLPLYVTTTVYYETRAVEVEREVDEVARAYAAEKIDELQFVGDFNSDYTVKPLSAGLYRVNLFLSGEALISRGVEAAE